MTSVPLTQEIGSPRTGADTPAMAWDVLAPAEQTMPLVLASPHSGTHYPAEFLALSRLDRSSLRRSEDSFVDELFGAAPALGAPLLRARFARAYIDANREPFELDSEMFIDPLPDYINHESPRVAAGLGTIARVAAGGSEIYRAKLRFSDALQRIETLYRPYHAALRALVDRTREKFGFCILLDCHSMPTTRAPSRTGEERAETDIVLGDCFGLSCAPVVTALAHDTFTAAGLTVSRNRPYAGGFTTRHYGQPGLGVHALQIEVSRALYMCERTLRRGAQLGALAERMAEVVAALGRIEGRALAPRPSQP
ncbi:MAG: N-formylglutamate amidohydrolase [Alphaproteobacteria bacterium]